MPKISLIIGLIAGILTFAQSAAAQKLPPIEQILSERVLGKADAPVTMIEYAALTCSHCAAFHNGPYNDIKKEYIETGKVKLIVRDFPLNNLGLAAAMMARCLPPDRYFGTMELLFRGQQSWTRDPNPAGALAGVGRLAGMSQATFEACLQNRDVVQGIRKMRDEGQAKFKVQSTPTFVINGTVHAGGRPIEEFRNILDAALAAAK